MAERGLSAGEKVNAKTRASNISVLFASFSRLRRNPSLLLTFLVQRLVFSAARSGSGGGRRSVRLLGNLGRLDIVRSDFDRGAFEAPAREEEGSLGCRFLVAVTSFSVSFLWPREKRKLDGRERCPRARKMLRMDEGGSPLRTRCRPSRRSDPRCQQSCHRTCHIHAASQFHWSGVARRQWGRVLSGVREGEIRGTDEKKCSRVSLVVVDASPLTRTTCALVAVVVDEVEAIGEVVVCRE